MESGDWIPGDAAGVVVLPQSLAVEYTNRAMDVLEKENRIREEIKEGRTPDRVVDLLRVGEESIKRRAIRGKCFKDNL